MPGRGGRIATPMRARPEPSDRQKKSRRRSDAIVGCFVGGPDAGPATQLRWLLISLVISNIETWAFLKISFSLASALIIVRLALSCRPFFLM